MKSLDTVEATKLLDGPTLRKSFGQVPSGVVALCAMADGAPAGTVLSSFVPISLDPALVAISFQNGSRTWNVLRETPALGITVMSDSQETVARRLASSGTDRFAGVDYSCMESGAIRLGEGAGYFECTLASETAAGDHVLVILEIRHVELAVNELPLIFHRSSFVSLEAKTTAA